MGSVDYMVGRAFREGRDGSSANESDGCVTMNEGEGHGSGRNARIRVSLKSL